MMRATKRGVGRGRVFGVGGLIYRQRGLGGGGGIECGSELHEGLHTRPAECHAMEGCIWYCGSPLLARHAMDCEGWCLGCWAFCSSFDR